MSVKSKNMRDAGNEMETAEKGAAGEDTTKDLIRELGLLTTGTDFESDIQYININGFFQCFCVLQARFSFSPPFT